MFSVVVTLLCPNEEDTVLTSAPLLMSKEAFKCPYGIIRTNRKTLALQRVGWFVLILFPLKKALEWGLREGVKN